MRSRLPRAFLLLALGLVLMTAVWPGTSRAEEPILLRILNSPLGGTIAFRQEDLRQFEWHEVVTHTSFSEGEQVFRGPLLGDVLASCDVRNGTVFATAVDGYGIDLSVDAIIDNAGLLALVHNGEQMTVRTRGPLRIVFPMSQEQADQRYLSAESVWQLTSIDVKP